VKVRNQVIDTAMINTKFRIGAKVIKYGHNPVSVAAKTPVTTVAK